MTPYYPAILAHVQTEFPTSLLYSVSFQIQFSTFLDTFVVPLVDPTKPIEEQDINLANAFQTGSPGNYNLASGALKLKMYTAAEWVVNLVKDANSGSGGTSKIFFTYFTQIGPFEPSNDGIPVNDTGELPIWTYDSPGSYHLTWPTLNPMPNANKVNAFITNIPVNDTGPVLSVQARVIAPNKLLITIGIATIAGPAIEQVLADSLVSHVALKVEIFN